MRLNIGLKLGFWLALLGMLSTTLMGVYTYTQSRRVLLESSQDKLLTATRVLGLRFSHSVASVTSDVKFVASLPALKRLADGRGREEAASEVQDAMMSLMLAHPEYYQMRFIGLPEHGREMVRVDRVGAGVAAIVGRSLQEKAEYPYFFKTLKLSEGEFYVSRISLNTELGAHEGEWQPTLRIATPVFGWNGQAFGVVVVNVDLNSLFRYVRQDVPADIDILLTNQDGDYLIHPDATRTFGFDKGKRYRLQEDVPGTSALFLQENIDHAVFNLHALPGVAPASVAAFIKVPFISHSEQHFVVVGLLTPMQQILEESRAMGWGIVRIMLIVSVLTLGIALLLAKYLAHPLHSMARAVQRFAAGQPMGILPLNRNDEIGYLAQSFRAMADRLSARVDELQNHQEVLGNLAYHDQLTGLPNRLLFLDRVQQALVKASRHPSKFAVVFIDLDKFKEINDTYGHAVGDAVLKIAAQRMKECIRGADTLARLAGDEFTMLLEDLNSPEDAARVANKIVDYFRQPFVIDSLSLRMSCSLGISLYPQDGQSLEVLLENADSAMYRAKEGGRNAYCFFDEKAAGETPSA
jgi:diguanylate cyclase (GGDEF)-like protein